MLQTELFPTVATIIPYVHANAYQQCMAWEVEIDLRDKHFPLLHSGCRVALKKLNS